MKLYKHLNGKCNACGSNVRRYREQNQLSQEQFAAKLQLIGLNLNQKAISRVETGERVVPDFELFFFSEVLGVTILDLLGENPVE